MSSDLQGIQQGDLVELDFDPASGHEPKKRRPAVVVSTGFFNNIVSSLVAVCPVTHTDNGHPLHIPLPSDAGLGTHGFVCIEQVRTVDPKSRCLVQTGAFLDEGTMDRVLTALGSVFGI